MYAKTNGSAKPLCLSGASLAQLVRRMSPVERAILGAELVEGRRVLEPPTAKTAAALVHVGHAYLFAALRLTPDQRSAVLAGERPLVEPRRCAPPPIDWGSVDDEALVEAVRLIGVNRAFDAVIAAETEHTST
ncbi:MAG: hypothetical protein C5B56_00550 [Proteobacteria bacterium]|nr:MAG: hypothetical protein C5B56_00550 [Pseudomonadota bacterium]